MIVQTRNLDRALRREKKRYRKQHGMRRDGDSVFVIQKAQEKRDAEVLKKRRKNKRKEKGEWR